MNSNNKLTKADPNVLPAQIQQIRTNDIIQELTPDVVESRLEKQAQLRNAFLKHVRKSMKKDIHYMPGLRKGSQAYLKQEGALLLAHFFECEDDYEILREDREKDFYAITIKCSLFHPSGKTYTGLGWSNSREYNFITSVEAQSRRVIKSGNSDINPEAIKKAFYFSQLETVQQMARKRSLVSAARHLPFVSELFTSESENEEGIAENSEQGLKAKHKKRLRYLMSWFKSEGINEDSKIKESLSKIVSETVNSKSLFVSNDDLWDKFSIHVNDIRENRNYE